MYKVLITILNFMYFLDTSSQLKHPIVIPLSGLQWTVMNSNGSIKVPTKIPGGIYTDLKNAEILREDIFYRYNDLKYRWVGKENWLYSTSFVVGSDVWQKDNIWLTFHGLDTIAYIFLNGVHIGKTDNMFVRYRFDVKALLKNETNELKIFFYSPIVAAADISIKYQTKFNYLVPPQCTPAEQHGECHVNFLRKMAASFSWDWGPAFPSVGIWKNIEIEAFNSVIIRSVSINVYKQPKRWEVRGMIYLDSSQRKYISGTGQINIYLQGGLKRVYVPHSDFNFMTRTDENGEAYFNFSNIFIDESLVKLWWPNGYGEQHLYILEIILNVDNEVSSLTTKFGFRTVELVQEPVDPNSTEKGLTFYFKINGVKVYAKGSNFIPAHILPELSNNKDVLINLLTAAKDVHMNMLRVWGGGVYESDLFYELCDEMGIMVWQDMMFACNMYPVSREFLQSVSMEVVQNVRRLHSHPSIVVWAGNNENEAALRGNWYGTARDFAKYKDDYITLYVNVIKALVNENDNTREYVVSSPSNGIKSEKEGFIAKDPYNPLYGDAHVYQYFADNWDHSNVQPNRFCSEYGIQGLPSYSTLINVARPNDMNTSSRFMKLRQHHGAGYSEIQYEIDMNLPGLNPDNFRQYIYFSQVNQGMSIKTMTEKYRSLRDYISQDGNGFNMGALYWQLNDVWQAPSWSSIEYGGKWKMLHYFAKSFFSPVIVIPSIKFDNITVMITSDVPPGGPTLYCTLDIIIYRWDSFDPVKRFSINTQLKPFSSVVVINNASIYDIVGDQSIWRNCGFGWEIKHKCFFVFKLHNNETSLSPDAFLFPERLTAVDNLKEATIQLKEVREIMFPRSSDRLLPRDSSHFEITISTNTIALFVWLDVGNIKGHFSDNGFHMVSPEKTINFISKGNVSAVELSKVLNIMTVKGHYKSASHFERLHYLAK